MVEQRLDKPLVASSNLAPGTKHLESNAAGMVLRLALKTRFSEMGWGSTPLLSAKFKWAVSDNGSTGALHVLGKSSILLRSTKFLYLVRLSV